MGESSATSTVKPFMKSSKGRPRGACGRGDEALIARAVASPAFSGRSFGDRGRRCRDRAGRIFLRPRSGGSRLAEFGAQAADELRRQVGNIHALRDDEFTAQNRTSLVVVGQ